MTRGRKGRIGGIPTKPPARETNDLWVYLALLLITLAIYSQVRDFSFVNFDDPEHLTDNVHVRDGFTLAGLVWAWQSANLLWNRWVDPCR